MEYRANGKVFPRSISPGSWNLAIVKKKQTPRAFLASASGYENSEKTVALLAQTGQDRFFAGTCVGLKESKLFLFVSAPIFFRAAV